MLLPLSRCVGGAVPSLAHFRRAVNPYFSTVSLWGIYPQAVWCIYTHMASVFSGTLTGQGQVTFAGGSVVPTDVDILVTTIGPRVSTKGPAPYRKLQFAGWILFTQSAFNEAVSEPVYFNWESQDAEVHNVPGSTSDGFSFFVQPGTEVHVNVSA